MHAVTKSVSLLSLVEHTKAFLKEKAYTFFFHLTFFYEHVNIVIVIIYIYIYIYI